MGMSVNTLSFGCAFDFLDSHPVDNLATQQKIILKIQINKGENYNKFVLPRQQHVYKYLCSLLIVIFIENLVYFLLSMHMLNIT